MTKEELVEKLTLLADDPTGDWKRNHGEADDLLLEFIGDPEVFEAFTKIKKWYA